MPRTHASFIRCFGAAALMRLVNQFYLAFPLAVILATSLGTSARAEDPPTFVQAWGSAGNGDGQFLNPQGIGVDSQGFVYLADSQNRRMIKFSPVGTFPTPWQAPAGSESAFGGPLDIVVGPDGTIFVSGGALILVFGADLIFQRQWSVLPAAAAARSLALDPTGQFLYMTNYIYMYKFRTSDGAFINSWQYAGNDPGSIIGFCVGPSGTIYAPADGGINRFDSSGNYLGSWTPVIGAGAVAVDSDEHLYIAGGGHIGKYTSEGTLISQWSSTGVTVIDVGVDIYHNVYGGFGVWCGWNHGADHFTVMLAG